jgi:hypothetical protein
MADQTEPGAEADLKAEPGSWQIKPSLVQGQMQG